MTPSLTHKGGGSGGKSDQLKGLKASWIRNLYIKTAAPWVQLAKYIVGDTNKIALFGSDWTVQKAKQMDNRFWKDVLSAWACVLQNFH